MRSTVGMIKDFKEGRIWSDIEDELHLWLEDIRDRLEDPDKSLFTEDIKRLQGNAEAVRNVLMLPDNLILNIEGEKDGSRG